MPTPGEHKTVQSRIHEYAEAIHLRQGYGGQVGWTVVSRKEAEQKHNHAKLFHHELTKLHDLFRTLLHELMTAKTRLHELQLHQQSLSN